MASIKDVSPEVTVAVNVSVQGVSLFRKTLRLPSRFPTSRFIREKIANWINDSYEMDLSGFLCRVRLPEGEDFSTGDSVNDDTDLDVDFIKKPNLEHSSPPASANSQATSKCSTSTTAGVTQPRTSDTSNVSDRSDHTLDLGGTTPPSSTPKTSTVRPNPVDSGCSEVPPGYEMYCFNKNQAYDLDRLINKQSLHLKSKILALSSLDSENCGDFLPARRSLFRICGKWLLKHCIMTGLPSKHERALMAFSCVTRFPVLYDHESPLKLGWDYIFDPVSCQGLLGKGISNRRRYHKQKYPQVRTRPEKRKLSFPAESVDIEASRLQLKSLRGDSAESRRTITELMKATTAGRIYWIRTTDPAPHVNQVLQKWPRLKEIPMLAIYDADFCYLEKDPNYQHRDFVPLYTELAEGILKEAISRSSYFTAHNSPNRVGLRNLLREFNLEKQESLSSLDQGEKNLISLLCLPYLLSVNSLGSAEKFFEEVFCFKQPSCLQTVSQDGDSFTNGTQPCLLIYSEGGKRSGVIKEVYIVVDKVPLKQLGSVDLVSALEILHAWYWAMHLSYPKVASPLYQMVGKIKGQDWGVSKAVIANLVHFKSLAGMIKDKNSKHRVLGEVDNELIAGSYGDCHLDNSIHDSDSDMDNI